MKTVAREEFVRDAEKWFEAAQAGDSIEVVEEGRPVVVVSAKPRGAFPSYEEMIRRLDERRAHMTPVTQEEIRNWIDEGRRR